MIWNKSHEPEIMPNGRVAWGIMEKVEPVGDGLLLANLSGQDYLVDESLQPILEGLRGQPVTVGHVAGRWRAGRCVSV